jgi:hypothetical protein
VRLSPLLTLIVVSVVYTYLDDSGNRKKRRVKEPVAAELQPAGAYRSGVHR